MASHLSPLSLLDLLADNTLIGDVSVHPKYHSYLWKTPHCLKVSKSFISSNFKIYKIKSTLLFTFFNNNEGSKGEKQPKWPNYLLNETNIFYHAGRHNTFSIKPAA